MGHKLDLEPDDELFESEKITVKGISAGCYCCGAPMYIHFDNIKSLSCSQKRSDYFYMLVCRLCNQDIEFLNKKGIENVSYDLMWFIQEDLKTKTKKTVINSKERRELIYKYYTRYEGKKK